MAEERMRSIEERFKDDDLITEAIRQGVWEELLSQARAGNSVPGWENGPIVWSSPREIYERLGYAAPPDIKAS